MSIVAQAAVMCPFGLIHGSDMVELSGIPMNDLMWLNGLSLWPNVEGLHNAVHDAEPAIEGIEERFSRGLEDSV